MRHACRPAPPPDPSAPLGVQGEDLACAHLVDDDGLELVERNWRLPAGELRGELDVVALDHRRRLVVVVEVKARRSDAHGGPLAAVTARKRAQVRRLVGSYLPRADLPYRAVRLDVVGLWLPRGGPRRLEHLQGVL